MLQIHTFAWCLLLMALSGPILFFVLATLRNVVTTEPDIDEEEHDPAKGCIESNGNH